MQTLTPSTVAALLERFDQFVDGFIEHVHVNYKYIDTYASNTTALILVIVVRDYLNKDRTAFSRVRLRVNNVSELIVRDTPNACYSLLCFSLFIFWSSRGVVLDFEDGSDEPCDYDQLRARSGHYAIGESLDWEVLASDEDMDALLKPT